MSKPPGHVSGKRTPGWSWCFACDCNRRYGKDTARCKTCGRVIWEVQAEINGVALRTTSATYKRLINSQVDNES